MTMLPCYFTYGARSPASQLETAERHPGQEAKKINSSRGSKEFGKDLGKFSRPKWLENIGCSVVVDGEMVGKHWLNTFHCC